MIQLIFICRLSLPTPRFISMPFFAHLANEIALVVSINNKLKNGELAALSCLHECRSPSSSKHPFLPESPLSRRLRSWLAFVGLHCMQHDLVHPL